MNNPSVNRYLEDKAFDHMDHALGRPVDPMRESYRNYFATDVDSQEAKEFGASENWELDGLIRGMAYFSVTDTGRKALKDHLDDEVVHLGKPWRSFVVEFNGFSERIPAKSRAQARYLRYLNIADIYPSLKFGEFVRRSSVRVAA
ncbi:hypothetical protein [Rhizobium lentis]|uniref:Uncharacterized protein n=1 Tax=Rhizobium lentis TaxID=1138194 RepID=A0A9Q3M729_9HYPH|nr:hypothetical protein [Rhizobium lentis]MBX5021182.1 hypothetical protein [Rhizobium lentis]